MAPMVVPVMALILDSHPYTRSMAGVPNNP